MKNIIIVNWIEKYQRNKSIIGVGHCKFYPTCSEYAKETYKKFNFFYASILSAYRLLRCNPLNTRKYDPVKLTKEEKRTKKYFHNINQYLDCNFTNFLLNIDNLDIDNSTFYQYLYDYYHLPINTHLNINAELPLNINQEFLIVNKEIKRVNELRNKPFDEFIKITNELFNNKIIKHHIDKDNILNNPTTLYILPLDYQYLKDCLDIYNIKEGIILINNGEDIPINYLDFPEITIDLSNHHDLLNVIKDYKKLIIKTKVKNILEYLPFIDYSINIYQEITDINYFYDLNLKRRS